MHNKLLEKRRGTAITQLVFKPESKKAKKALRKFEHKTTVQGFKDKQQKKRRENVAMMDQSEFR